uniref:dephospho-CoA kinase domain-containing protein-like n=1 Tax=Styela clava TaxID=7725 RepID=UPI00193943A1|nr:dephospho-CoA kinase domain-containing protein-like [Styela clava]
MILVGLTGGIASGKSTVSSILKNDFNCPVIDADLIARQVVEPGAKAHRKIIETFGNGILLADGTLDRGKLGEIIFQDKAKRRKLNAITHPEIGKVILISILKYLIRGHRFVILDVPLLFESKTWINLTTFNVVVYCDFGAQLSRLMNRNSLSESEAKQRIDSQMSLEEKQKLASIVINNNGSLDETYKQVEELHKLLQSSKRYLILRISILLFILCLIYLFLMLIG